MTYQRKFYLSTPTLTLFSYLRINLHLSVGKKFVTVQVKIHLQNKKDEFI